MAKLPVTTVTGESDGSHDMRMFHDSHIG